MLTAPAITELEVESSTYAIFAEWLAKYFDGGTHAVGGNVAVPLPKAVIAFGQSPVTQPLNPALTASVPPAPQASITMVWGVPLATDRRWETVDGVAQLMIYKKVRWNFWVRCEMQAGPGNNARKLARQMAEKLSALLLNPATAYGLAQKGILRCRPSEPEPVADTGFILMLVACRAVLRYPVRINPGVVTADNVRLVNGALELWDSGQAAFVPLTLVNGTLGVGGPDFIGLPQVQAVLNLLNVPGANVRLNNGALEIWDSGRAAFTPLTVVNGALGTGPVN